MATIDQFPTTFALDFRPLQPGDGLGDGADEALIDLAEHGFVVALGVHDRQVGALACMASQDRIREYCPNDEKRFGSTSKIVNWLSKGRQMVGIYTHEGQSSYEVDAIADVRGNKMWQVAYAWFGPETSKHIPGADITTAYRVGDSGRRISRERRHNAADAFRLGLPLGKLVSAIAIHKYDLHPGQISLETWQSNGANKLYDQLGFVRPAGFEPIPDNRPTLKPVGSFVAGHEVYTDESGIARVVDYRLHKVLNEAT